MRVLKIFVAPLLAAAFLGAPPAHASTGPGCHVISQTGAGTLSNYVAGPSNGAGTLIMDGLYADEDELIPNGFAFEYQNLGSYQQGETTADYAVHMTVHGTPVQITDHNGYSPGYYLHGTWGPTWTDSAGIRHAWVKGDRIVIIVNVVLHPDLRNGWTEGICTL